MNLPQQVEAWLTARGQGIVETHPDTGLVRGWGQEECWVVACADGSLPPGIAFHAALGALVTGYRSGGSPPTSFALGLPETDVFRSRVEALAPAVREILPWVQVLWLPPAGGTVIRTLSLDIIAEQPSRGDSGALVDLGQALPAQAPASPAAALCRFLLLCPLPAGATETAVARDWTGRALQAKLLHPEQARGASVVPLVRLATRLPSLGVSSLDPVTSHMVAAGWRVPEVPH